MSSTERRRTPRVRAEVAFPGERRAMDAGSVVRAYQLAVVLPPLVAVAMVPFRVDHATAAATVMVVPVVLVALLGSTTAAVVAAATGSIAYGVLLTEPYGQLLIDDPADVVETVVLLAVGLGVGITSSRLTRVRVRADTRRRELDHVVAFARTATGTTSPEVLIAEARERIVDLLQLESCEWSGIPHLSGRPVLLPRGSVMGYQRDLAEDRSQLPACLDLPAVAMDYEKGHFVLTPRPETTTSLEERAAAATIASLLAAAMAWPEQPWTSEDG